MFLYTTSMSNTKKGEGNIGAVTKGEQYRAVNELFDRSQANSTYFAALILSSVIISCGLLLDNSAVVIGGMLVAPVLTPLLTVGLGIAVGEISAIRAQISLLFKSFILVIGVAFFFSILLGGPNEHFIFEDTARAAILYFAVATASGAAATFAWVRKEMSEALPGIAIAVSIVPPLALVGIWLSKLNLEISRYFIQVFLFNLFGIIVGSVVVFSYLKFYRVEKRVETIEDEKEAEQLVNDLAATKVMVE